MTDSQHIGDFADDVLGTPWGMLSRAQTDYLIFRLLVRSGRIDMSKSDFDLANELRTTVTRLRALRFRLDQDEVNARGGDMTVLLVPENFMFEQAREAAKLRVAVRSRYLREYLVAALQKHGSIALSELTPTTLLVTPKDLVTALTIVAIDDTWVRTQEAQGRLEDLVNALQHRSAGDSVKSRVETALRGSSASIAVVGAIASVLQYAFPVVVH